MLVVAALSFSYAVNALADNLQSQKVDRIGKVDKDPTQQKSNQVRYELEQLNKASETSLKEKVRNGDPLAGLALAHKNSQESQSLTTIPMLANSAAEDALYWSNLAARMGALESRSVNGLNVIPLRATRNPKR